MQQGEEAIEQIRGETDNRAELAGVVQSLMATASRYVFLIAVSLALLSQGAVNPVSLAIVAGLFGLVAVYSLLFLGEPKATAIALRAAIFIALLLVGAGVVQTVHLETMANPVWADLGAVVNSKSATISVAPTDTWAALVTLGLPFVVFISGLVLFSSDDEALRLTSFLGILGGFLAVWAVAEFTLSPATLLLSKKFYYLESLTAPFVNRNTAGTFYGVVSLLLAAQAYIEFQQADFSSAIFKTDPIPGKKRGGWRLAMSLFLLVMSLIALFLTKSRGGIGATFLSYIICVPLALSLSGNGRRRVASFRSDWRQSAWRAAKALIGLFVVIVVGVVFADYALFRAEVQGLSDPRFCIAPSIIGAANSNMLTGVGFGTFRLFFPAYRDPQCGIIGVFDRAHSVYLEGYLGLGFIFIIAVALGVVLLLYFLLKGITSRRSLRVYPIAGLGVLILVLGHSLIDFSLQIPAFAIVFAAAMAALVTISKGRAYIPPDRK